MSGGGGTSATTQQLLTPQQQQLLSQVTPIAAGYAAHPPAAYSGQLTAPVSPYTYQGENMALGAAMGPMQAQANQAAAGSQWLTSGQALDARSNPYLQSAINAAVQPISQNFQQTVMPGINDSAQLAGQYGYNRQALQTNLATQDYLRQLGSTTATMANAGYGEGLQAMTSALQSAPGITAATALPGQIVSAVGTQRQQLQQQAIDAAMQQYYTQQFLPLTVAQQIASMAFGMPGGSATTTQGGGGGGASSIFGDIAGLGTGAAGIAALLPLLGLSDRRMKQNIVLIGKTPKGHPLYEFEFIRLPGIRVQGMMAQDVPYAAVDIDGILHIDYSKVI